MPMQNFDLKQRRKNLWLAAMEAVNQPSLDKKAFVALLDRLSDADRFWAYPGGEARTRIKHYLDAGQHVLVTQLVNNCCYALDHGRYRQQRMAPFQTHLELLDRPVLHEHSQLTAADATPQRPYFEVLVVHPAPEKYEALYRQQLGAFKSAHDEYLYDLVFVDCAEDAITAILSNTDIQACVYLNHIAPSTPHSHKLYAEVAAAIVAHTPPSQVSDSIEVDLCRTIGYLRPELDHYLISELSPSDLPFEVREHFGRVMFHVNPFRDLHEAILNGIRSRYTTPFFDALQAYSRQPKGVFHALPLSRGSSVKASPWIHDMLDFYGDNIFLAETSSTQGGLDSLLDPTGAIKQAHNKAAAAFGAQYSYFVTNGTSTSNKIVTQANLKAGDIVMVSADCHKSIPYSVMLAGAYPIFLETYPLVEHDLYGGIDLAQIKAVMLDLRKHGRLDRLKQITLTNSTFDGLIYHTENYMMEILALKPDIIFHWDEAWFAFSHFHPLYHSRTAMTAVQKISQRMASEDYRAFYAEWKEEFDASTDPDKWQQTLYPDPAQVQLRVYSTQSTHKTLSSFRQGSMIHVHDVQFKQDKFLEAFRIHTSTSPNYQLIASLDIARRQAALEGFHLVRRSILLAMQLRQRIRDSELLKPYFDVLDDAALIPVRYRDRRKPGKRKGPKARSVTAAQEPLASLAALSANWGPAGFVVDPTRVTLNISKTGINGSSFRQLLMTRYDIQVNKTSRHTVLFLINIGATQATIDYLMQVLHEMAAKFEQEKKKRAVDIQAEATLPLPERRIFHPAFLPFEGGEYHVSDIRDAYFKGADEANVTYLPLSPEAQMQVMGGKVFVSASFVTPYPPGFPVIVPGQIITTEILNFFQHIKVKEIHGYSFEKGFKVFREDFLNQITDTTG